MHGTPAPAPASAPETVPPLLAPAPQRVVEPASVPSMTRFLAVDGEAGAAHKQLTHTLNLLHVRAKYVNIEHFACSFHCGTTRILGTKTVIYNSSTSIYLVSSLSLQTVLSYVMSLLSLTHTPELSPSINCICKIVYKKSSTRTYLVLTVFESSSLRVEIRDGVRARGINGGFEVRGRTLYLGSQPSSMAMSCNDDDDDDDDDDDGVRGRGRKKSKPLGGRDGGREGGERVHCTCIVLEKGREEKGLLTSAVLPSVAVSSTSKVSRNDAATRRSTSCTLFMWSSSLVRKALCSRSLR